MESGLLKSNVRIVVDGKEQLLENLTLDQGAVYFLRKLNNLWSAVRMSHMAAGDSDTAVVVTQTGLQGSQVGETTLIETVIADPGGWRVRLSTQIIVPTGETAREMVITYPGGEIHDCFARVVLGTPIVGPKIINVEYWDIYMQGVE